MTEEQYEKAGRLYDEKRHIYFEIGVLEQAAERGTIYVCPKRESPDYNVKIDGKKAAGIIGAWIEERKARIADIDAEFNAL